MWESHGFRVGHPLNLVHVDAFLDTVQATMARCECIYCGHVYPSYAVLRQHMRKKKHLRIHPSNATYDQFYIANYVAEGRHWDEMWGAEGDEGEDDQEDQEEDGEGEAKQPCRCLFCPSLEPSVGLMFVHCKEAHGFDVERTVRALGAAYQWSALRMTSLGLDFYGAFRLLNWLRIRLMRDLRCCFCDEQCNDASTLAEHVEHAQHARMPATRLWDDDRYARGTISLCSQAEVSRALRRR